MSQSSLTKPLTDEQLNSRITSICESIRVVPLIQSFYREIPVNIINKRLDTNVLSKPVCMTTPRLTSSANCNTDSPPFELYTFYNWLRSGFRIIPKALSFRFQVFKGIGLSIPSQYMETQDKIQSFYHYHLLPNPIYPDSPYGILETGSERRIGGAAYMSLLIPDAQGYEWLDGDPLINIPILQGLFRLSTDYCKLLGITSDTFGQNIRRFSNPFRISDLQLLRMLSKNLTSCTSHLLWRTKAEAIIDLSNDLAGFYGDPRAYATYVCRMIGRASASLICHRILHGQLTDHCQNITLGGELTEFDYSVKVPSIKIPDTNVSDDESRLYSQVILLANHVRHFADCMNWIGLECHYIDYISPFVFGIKELLSKKQTETFLSNLETTSYCIDITLSAHNRFSSENLNGCDKFIQLFRKIAYEVLS